MTKDPYASLKHGLVGCWIPSISGSGLLLPDLSGRNNNGVLTNMDASDWVSSGTGRALDFDGVDDYVATNTELTSQFGISYWFNRRTGGTFGSRISWGNTVDGDVYAGNIGSNFVGVQSNDSGTVKTFQGFTINNNTWYHLIINRDESNNVRVYLNTIQSTSGAQSVAGTFTLNGLGRYSNAIGGNAPFQWDGMLDDIRTYNRALTEAEIRLLASKRGIGLQPSPTRFIAKQQVQGTRRRRILTGQT